MAAANEQMREVIERTRAYLLRSEHLSEPEKDNLGALLDSARFAMNGGDDQVGAVVGIVCGIVVYEVKRAIRAPLEIGAAIEAHALTCSRPTSQTGRVAIALQLARSWPLWVFASVAVMSPHFGAILGVVKSLILRT